MELSVKSEGLLSPPSTSATSGSGEKPTDATIHACRPTKEKAPFVAKAEKRKTEYNKNIEAYNKKLV
ncbi:hypothetical protein RHGRI_033894 [Rhododendron griersonianum]|uniref:Uncharacterized protein n=1 Tax=Rhododendron griersonianum TaxID=479676 RepID=A0AAV6HZB3_9ERIC|nr:hypothetical protein RHGRI_033894 [Rhododendron griersonianum]